MPDDRLLDIQVAKTFGWTLDYVDKMPHVDWLHCLEAIEIQSEIDYLNEKALADGHSN